MRPPVFNACVVRCVHCATPMEIPLQEDYTNPLYVWQVQEDVQVLHERMAEFERELFTTAEECVEQGMESSLVAKLQLLAKQFKDLKRDYGIR